ncbi:lactoylglutathione lyase / glyoxalase I family protein [Striga asiatica]|uniref:Lactoylglutathione lyase / glyoxalase I family protein n=1 Tax=Striga asiatica TaxID=4170 RepID=A0A5A7QUQ3_STRAF|nr:lactoylglutathione lyase / glyoxalase I family protein [Striga asiatica]
MGGGEKLNDGNAPLKALNHVSRVCRSVEKSVEFYTKILGFVVVERPETFDFDGAWLFNYGVGVHLVKCRDDDEEKLPGDANRPLDPMDNHISFQCEKMEEMEQKLKEGGVKYMKRTIGEEEGAPIDQLFLNDPDGFMIEICNCENLKLQSSQPIKLPSDKHNPPIELTKTDEKGRC